MIVVPALSHNEETLTLGLQAGGGEQNMAAELAHKIHAWAPTRARSFSIRAFIDTDANGYRSSTPTGYATADVLYYSTRSEGHTRLVAAGWSRICNEEKWALTRTGRGAQISFLGNE